MKRIEKELGIQRDNEIAEVDGYQAVKLWKQYEKGNDEALNTLIAYNLADVENLKVLMELAFTEKSKQLLNF